MALGTGSYPCSEPGYPTQVRQQWCHSRRSCLKLRPLRRGGNSIACKGNRLFLQLCYGNLMRSFTPVAIGCYKCASKGNEYTAEKVREYCLETDIIQTFAPTNTSQQIGESERVGKTLCAMIRCVFADSGFPSFM